MSDFQTASTLEGAGMPEDETTEAATPIDRTDTRAGTFGRDLQSDAGRMGAPSQQLDTSGYRVDTGVTGLGEEKENEGWDRLARPSGADPLPVATSGTRGAADIRPWPKDADQASDTGSGYGDEA